MHFFGYELGVRRGWDACKDLRQGGLVESVGRASLLGPGGRPVREMGGTARETAKAGAAHALAVTDTIDAFRQSPPLPTKPVARRGEDTDEPRPLPARPRGMGHLRGRETEVALPVSGTFASPAKSLRADAVLSAPPAAAGPPTAVTTTRPHRGLARASTVPCPARAAPGVRR